MLVSSRAIVGSAVDANDERLGKVRDLYFLPADWTVRFVLLETDHWFSGRTVCVPTEVFDQVVWTERNAQVAVDREQIERVSQHDVGKAEDDIDLARSGSWSSYWSADDPTGGTNDIGGGASADASSPSAQRTHEQSTSGTRLASPASVHPLTSVDQPASQRELRLLKTLWNFHVETIDGSVGHIDDFLIDDQSWEIRYIVVETRNWMPGRRVLVGREAAESISWPQQRIRLRQTSQAVRESPSYEPESE